MSNHGTPDIHTLTSHTEEITSLSFNPSASLLATGSWDTTVKIWHTRTGKLLRTLRGHGKEITAVEFSPDGKLLASASWDTTVRLWNVPLGEAGVGRDGDMEYSSPPSRSPSLADGHGGDLHCKLVGHEKEVSTLQFSPSSKTLASSAWNIIHLWDATTGELLHRLTEPEGDMSFLRFSPNNDTLASASRGRFGAGSLRLWDTSTGTQTATLPTKGWPTTAVAFSPTDEYVLADATAATPDVLRLHDTRTGQVIRRLKGHRSTISSVDFSPDGRHIATSSADRTMRVWDAANGEQIGMLGLFREGVERVAFSRSGALVVGVCAMGEEVRVWDWTAGRVVGACEEGGGCQISAVGFEVEEDGREVVWVGRVEETSTEAVIVRMEVAGDG